MIYAASSIELNFLVNTLVEGNCFTFKKFFYKFVSKNQFIYLSVSIKIWKSMHTKNLM